MTIPSDYICEKDGPSHRWHRSKPENCPSHHFLISLSPLPTPASQCRLFLFFFATNHPQIVSQHIISMSVLYFDMKKVPGRHITSLVSCLLVASYFPTNPSDRTISSVARTFHTSSKANEARCSTGRHLGTSSSSPRFGTRLAPRLRRKNPTCIVITTGPGNPAGVRPAPGRVGVRVRILVPAIFKTSR